jgi:N-methylhydantoinase B
MTEQAAHEPWDGRRLPYEAPATLDIHESVKLHTPADAEIDPISFEVLRHALWQLNIEHGTTIMRVSGSPIAALGHDFNPIILDEVGDYVFFGPYLQYLAAPTSSGVKWTLENRSEDPGIYDGDVFLTNDPWIGSAHQSDVAVFAPVFVGEEIFCWVGNTLHQWDLGGTAAGGFSPFAEDMFWEPPSLPPIKLVERGHLRTDLEEAYTNLSRMPQMVALDLRAQLSGVAVARDRMLKLVERYGAGQVKATMRKLQDDSESAFARRLETIPDGTWTEETWIESARPGDKGLYRNRMTLTKRGDRLIFSNAGSAAQDGTLATSYLGWKGGIVAMLASQMLFDQMFAIEGALRHCDFEAEAGLITCAVKPAAVCSAPATTLMSSLGLAGLVISKMLACSSDESLRSEVESGMGEFAYALNQIAGVDQHGNQFMSFLQDALGAALPAWSWRDGQDTGGWPWDLQSTMPNVEENELFYPVLYLWRREVASSGGAGRYRGGNGGEFAFTAHRTPAPVSVSTATSQLCVPSNGQFGGLPSSTTRFALRKGERVLERVRDGAAMPTSEGELQAEVELIQAKSFNNEVGVDDVWVCSWAAASGYGDPLLRPPAEVEADLRAGRVGEDWARRAYGVVAGDAEETTALRERLRADRLGSSPALPLGEQGNGEPLTEAVVRAGDSLRCRSCGHELAPAEGNYKDGARLRRVALAEVIAAAPNSGDYTETKIEAGLSSCPQCGLQLAVEVLVGGEEPAWDVRIGATTAADARTSREADVKDNERSE